jgi:methionine-rich copper-binding protein CopC
MAEIKTKQSFGGAYISHISPAVTEQIPKSMNVHLSFEEALKLHFSLGQLLGKINSYNRSTKAGRRAAANICIYPHKLRITLNEGKLKQRRDEDSSADRAEAGTSTETEV